MASFESKVSEIFDEHPRLARKIPVVIRQLFQESESVFKKRMQNASEQVVQTSMLQLFDILYIDFYFDELDDRFLNWVCEHYPERFTASELEEMCAQADSHLDFYEIQDVIPGKGCYIKSLCSDNEGFLKDVSSSSRVVKWDIILARCYFYLDHYHATGSLSLFSPADKKFVSERIENARSEYAAMHQDSEFARFAKDRWDIFILIRQEITTKAKNRKFYINYGEFQLCEVRFRVQNLLAVLNVMKSLDEFNFIEIGTRKDNKKKRTIPRYQFDWLTQSIEEALAAIKTNLVDDGVILMMHQLDINGNPMGIEVIGNIYVDKFLCRLETRSLELAEFAVRHFARLFGDALVFKRILKLKSGRELKQDVEEEPTETADLMQQDSEFLNAILEKYYLDLLDKKISALNNLTPREARHDPAGRTLLIEWLKELENLLERQRLSGKNTISITKIKQALDMDW